jgi:hypothetical protein
MKKAKTLMENTRAKVENLTAELARETAARKTSQLSLNEKAEEIEILKQQYYQELEEQTRVLKEELAQRQIREKSLRQQEKELREQIKALQSASVKTDSKKKAPEKKEEKDMPPPHQSPPKKTSESEQVSDLQEEEDDLDNKLRAIEAALQHGKNSSNKNSSAS